jgi:membrane protein DedA with SNARE-associated domain
MEHFLTDVVARHGYIAVLLLMAASTACIPVPSEVVLLFGGALASSTFAETALQGGANHLDLALIVAVATIGTLVGSWVAYGIGAIGGRPLVDRAGKYMLFRPDEVDRAHAWFERHGDSAVLFARVIPVVRAFISLPAGVARMNPWRFSLYTLIGALTWDLGLAVAGYYLGQSWRTVEKFISPISIVIAVLLVGAIVWQIVRRVRARRGSRDAGPRGDGPPDGESRRDGHGAGPGTGDAALPVPSAPADREP